MTVQTDRINELLGNLKGERRTLVSPEGIPLSIQLANRGERIAAFTLDIAFMLLAIICLYLVLFFLFFAHTNIAIGVTIVLFLTFIVRNLYFIHFELAWQGRTPGKKMCNIKVINRNGGELTPSAVIARNITREVEFFLPLSLCFSSAVAQDAWVNLAIFGWVTAIAALPFFNKDHLRMGDIIGGTLVIAIPKRVLLDDLALATKIKKEQQYTFTHEQLSIYGSFELQVLEEFLRRPNSLDTQRLLEQVCLKICQKIAWAEAVPPQHVRTFLTEFYTAEREDLERGQLFGRVRLDKTGQAEPPKE